VYRVAVPSTVEFSATYVAGLRDALVAASQLEFLRSHATPALIELFDRPSAHAWWPGDQVFELTELVVAHFGAEALKTLTIQASQRRMGPIARPLINVLLLVSGTTPNSLLNKASTFVSIGIRPIVTTWVSTGPKTGTLSLRFPEPVPGSVALLWWGILNEAFSFLKTGRVVREEVQPTTHTFDLAFDVAS
jgi:hypothetical protein